MGVRKIVLLLLRRKKKKKKKDKATSEDVNVVQGEKKTFKEDVSKPKAAGESGSKWYTENNILVSGEGVTVPAPVLTWNECKNIGFDKTAIDYLNGKFPNPTPIQSTAWPLMMSKIDVFGVSK